MKAISLLLRVLTVLIFGYFGFQSLLWGQTTITIDINTAGITSTGYDGGAERTWTQDGVDFGAKAALKASGGNAGAIQFQANNGVIYNTSPIPGIIKEIEVVQNSANTFTLYGGSSTRLVNDVTANYTVTGGTAEGTTSGTDWSSTDLETNGYTFFALKKGAGASYITSIKITYVQGSNPPALANQTFNGTRDLTFSETPNNTGDPASSWTLVSGTLPSNLTLNTTTGEISGTPTVTANGTTVDIEASNSAGNSTATYTFNIAANPPILSNQTFNGADGIPFSETPSNTGGSASAWSTISGTLPAGLSFNTTTGEISGTPTETGSFILNLQATNVDGNDDAIYTIEISDAPCFSEDFADITVGDNISTNNNASPWTGNTNFPTVDRAYQAGGAVKLGTSSLIGSIESTSMNDVSGDITVSVHVKGWTTVEGSLIISIDGQSETVSYTATMSDDWEEVQSSFSGVTVGAKLKIETTAKRAFIDGVEIYCEEAPEVAPSLSGDAFPGQVGTPFSVALATTNLGGDVDDWTIDSGLLPAGLSLNQSTGVVSGEPEISGTYNVDIKAENTYGSDIATYTFTITSNPPALANQTFNGTVGESFSETPSNTGGTATSWNATGALPGWLSLNSSTGELSGTPTEVNTYQVELTASNENGTSTSTATYTIVISDVPCINIGDFTALPSGWMQNNVSFQNNEANFNSQNGDLTAVAVENPTAVSFDLRRSSNTTAKTLYVEVSTTSQTSGFTIVATYNHSNTTSAATTPITVDLSAYNNENIVYIRLRKESLTISPWYVKNFIVACDGGIYNPEFAIYRSTGSGNWTTVANWEVSDDDSGPWSPAMAYPDYQNAEKIYIESGDEIILDVDASVNHIEIKNGSTLIVDNDSQLRFYNENAGADFIVEGTFIYRSNTANSIQFLSSATWVLGSVGTIITTNTGGITAFRNNYETGMSNIPATAQWIFRKENNGTPNIATANMFFPNLRFENVSSTPYSSNSFATGFFTGTANTAIIKGNLEVGTTGTSTFKLHNNNSSSTPILVKGNLSIGAGSEITNEIAFSDQPGTGFEVEGNVNVDGTMNLIYGDGERILLFSGDNNQTISGSGTMNIGKLEVANGSGVINSSNVKIVGSLELVNGDFANANGTVTLDSDGASYSAYLDDFSEGYSGNYSGNITVHTPLFSSQGTSAQNKKKGYRQVSSPVDGATVSNALSHLAFGPTGVYANNSSLTSANFPTIWVYNETHKKSFNDNWYSYGGNLTAMMGVNVMIKNATVSNMQIDFTGTPHTGNKSRVLTNSNGAADGKGWNFIGNPYPSPIDWASVNKGSSDGNAYIFHTEGQYAGTYATVNAQGVGTNSANGVFAIGQGFLVYTTQASGSIQFTDADRVATSNKLFYGKSHLLSNELRLMLTDGTFGDEALSYTDFAASSAIDEGFDARKIPSKGNLYLAYAANGEDIAINVTDVIDEFTVLPLTLSVGETGIYELQLVQENLVGLIPYLKDNKSGNIIRLDNELPVVLTLKKDVVYDNYEVVFKDALSTSMEDGVNNIQIYTSNNGVFIKRARSEKANITITNLLGQNIVELETTEQEITIPLKVNRTQWIAIVKVVEKENTKTTKVLVK